MLKTTKEEGNISLSREEHKSQESSYLGTSIRVKGELSGKEDLVIQGQIKGKILLDENNLVIEEKGNVQAEIQAKRVTIRGKIEGNVFASEKVTITKDGRMTGEITASRISIEDGAQFKGSVKMDTKKTDILQPLSSEKK
jgi:cytoskeletal protein CcmA (bactofilin family)